MAHQQLDDTDSGDAYAGGLREADEVPREHWQALRARGARGADATLADPESFGQKRSWGSWARWPGLENEDRAMGDTACPRLEGRWRSISGGRDELPAWPPGPTDSDAWRLIPEHYWPATQPGVRGVVDGAPAWIGRPDQLRILGNGVVPQQAALAFRSLADDLGLVFE